MNSTIVGAPGYIMILPNHNLVGTCGSCGGPVVSPMLWASGDTSPPTAFCQQCGKRAKPDVVPGFGPIREMV